MHNNNFNDAIKELEALNPLTNLNKYANRESQDDVTGRFREDRNNK